MPPRMWAMACTKPRSSRPTHVAVETRVVGIAIGAITDHKQGALPSFCALAVHERHGHHHAVAGFDADKFPWRSCSGRSRRAPAALLTVVFGDFPRRNRPLWRVFSGKENRSAGFWSENREVARYLRRRSVPEVEIVLCLSVQRMILICCRPSLRLRRQRENPGTHRRWRAVHPFDAAAFLPVGRTDPFQRSRRAGNFSPASWCG